ncbi:MAG: Trk system potassium transporter TrkA [Clostridiales bacterium]|nr:Trk system potassium transporter TrkA [Clostridiales bacterium]
MDIIIIGAGKLGTGLASELTDEGHNVTVIDTNNLKLQHLVEKYDVQGICGSGTQIESLQEAKVKNCDLVVSATKSDEINILACLIAKKLGAKNTIARVRNPEYGTQFDFMRDDLGISMLVNPDFAAAREITNILHFPYAVNIETFANGNIDMFEFKIKPESNLCDCTISDIPNKINTKMVICAVERGDEVYIPNGDFVLRANDKVHITGEHRKLAEIGKKMANLRKNSIKNIMVIGCSRVAIYLSKMLLSIGKNVIIIEKDRDKCKRTLDMLDGATIINGDANDYEFLLQEGIDSMNAVVALTNTDEVNMLVSLYAQKFTDAKIVTKINNINIHRMMEDIGLDTQINVSEVTVDMITQYVRARENVSSSYMRTLYKLVDGQVEATEFVAGMNVSFLDKPLSTLKIKKNVLIAAINRNGKTIFPGGNDSIMLNDLVIVVSKGKQINNLNNIIQ